MNTMEDIDKAISSLQSSLEELCKSFNSANFNADRFNEKIDKISNWVDDQKKANLQPGEAEKVEKVGHAVLATVNAIQKFKSGDPYDITTGTLEMVSSVALLVGGPYGAAGEALCSIIGVTVSANKPREPSLIEILGDVAHKELKNFKRKLQGQIYNGLKDRITDQIRQLEKMRPGDELDDGELWKDYIQFLGELSDRFESPLPYLYSEHVSEDDNVKDCVVALVLYCQAHACFLSLLIAAKMRFKKLGDEKMEELVKRKIMDQTVQSRKKLAFLSDDRYLTFYGRLPSAGGKITKILALSRNLRAHKIVEVTLKGLSLQEMPCSSKVETFSKMVSKRRVILRLESHVRRPSAPWPIVQFINETKFNMKVVSGTVGHNKNNLDFVQDVQPYSAYHRDARKWWNPSFSTGGYIILCCDKVERSSSFNDRVFEFALSYPLIGLSKINIQDKTNSELTKGLDTYNQMVMSSNDPKPVYWVHDTVHFIAIAENMKYVIGISPFGKPNNIWRFVFQDFNPFEDVEAIPN